jgi:hypothetical protein
MNDLQTEDFTLLSQLIEADLSFCRFLYPLKLPPSLKRLRLSLTKMNYADLGSLELECPHFLEHLRLCVEEIPRLSRFKLNDDLTSLVFDEVWEFPHLINAPNLQSLIFQNLDGVRLPSLINLTNLKTLKLPPRHNWIPLDVWMKDVGPIVSLQFLALDSFPIDFRSFAHWPGLKTIDIFEGPLPEGLSEKLDALFLILPKLQKVRYKSELIRECQR